jgi:hypothetical protein
MIKRFASKAIFLTAMLASGTISSAALAQAQNASSVTLELFSEKPTESSEALASLEVGQDTGSLESIEVPDTASKARYMRANVTDSTGEQSYLFRVIAAPSNGRIFILTPDRKAIALNKFLASSGMEVSADKSVKLGTQTDFAAQNATVGESTDAVTAPNATEAAAPASTTPADAATPATPADASATPAATPATDANAATPAATPAPADASATPAATPAADATATPAATPATDASATPAATPATTAAPADASAMPAATPAADASATPAATPASSSSDAKALSEPVNTTLGKVELTVIPTGATAPASSASNFILAPIAGATEAKSSITGNVVTLSYGSSSSITDVAKFYDDQLKAQGFTLDEANATNASSADQVVRVYKRGTASVTMTVRADAGVYTVTVDLGSLASGS